MIDDTGSRIDQAIAWQVRQAEMGADDWHLFVLWLEEDAANAAAFDAVALDDRLVADRLALMSEARPVVLVAANDDIEINRGARRRWGWMVGGTAIAAGVAALLIPLALPRAGEPYLLTTQPGERHDVTLADGTRIEMGGGSRLQLDRRNMRVASLNAGEATFHVTHDAANPFTLRSGALTVQDVGTVFDVRRRGARLDIAVAEGSVLFQPGAEAKTLKAGDALVAREDMGTVEMAPVAIDMVGGWRQGQLSFAGEPLAEVAQSIRQLYGVDLVLAAGLSARPFTGMVRLSGAPARDIPHLAALIGAKWRHDGQRWTLSSAGPDTP